MMVLMNNEIEREAARLIDIRAMKETLEQELAKLRVLQQQVQKVLATYRDQTTGFNSLVTRQSGESTAAIAALTPLAASASRDALKKLRKLVESLLKKPGATPPPGTVTVPLKQPSRLYDLLNPAYGAARL